MIPRRPPLEGKSGYYFAAAAASLSRGLTSGGKSLAHIENGNSFPRPFIPIFIPTWSYNEILWGWCYMQQVCDVLFGERAAGGRCGTRRHYSERHSKERRRTCIHVSRSLHVRSKEVMVACALWFVPLFLLVVAVGSHMVVAAGQAQKTSTTGAYFALRWQLLYFASLVVRQGLWLSPGRTEMSTPYQFTFHLPVCQGFPVVCVGWNPPIQKQGVLVDGGIFLKEVCRDRDVAKNNRVNKCVLQAGAREGETGNHASRLVRLQLVRYSARGSPPFPAIRARMLSTIFPWLDHA